MKLEAGLAGLVAAVWTIAAISISNAAGIPPAAAPACAPERTAAVSRELVGLGGNCGDRACERSAFAGGRLPDAPDGPDDC